MGEVAWGWLQNPFCLVSLMELLRTRPEAFCRLVEQISRMLALANPPKGTLAENTQRMFLTFVTTLAPAAEEAKRLGFPSSVSQIERMQKAINNSYWSSDEMLYGLRSLQDRMVDDLKARLFLAVPFEKTEYYAQEKPIFGELVAARFPTLNGEIAEAGKCFALGRHTACVFHLMRVLEGGLRTLTSALQIRIKWTKPTWNTFIVAIQKRVAPTSPKKNPWQKYEVFAAGAAAHLGDISRNWRNPLVHDPAEKYDEEEARYLLQAVRSFMHHLATRLEEGKRKILPENK